MGQFDIPKGALQPEHADVEQIRSPASIPIGKSSFQANEGDVEDIEPQLGWYDGAAAQFEIVSPVEGDVHRTTWNLPWRAPVREVTADTTISPNALKDIRTQIRTLNIALREAKKNNRLGVNQAPDMLEDPVTQQMTELGRVLFENIFPQRLRDALKVQGSFYIEIGVDETLDEFPLELTCLENDEFLCLKHRVGRYIVRHQFTEKLPASSKLNRALLIAVPKVAGRNELRSVEPEARKVKELLERMLGAKNVICIGNCIGGLPETPSNLTNVLKKGSFEVVHFCGHGYYDRENEADSGLVMLNSEQSPDISPVYNLNAIKTNVGRSPPILCFINACESAQAAEVTGPAGIAHAFLDTGTCLLGSRSKVHDSAAVAFATEFYETLVTGQKSFGESVWSARNKCRDACKDMPEAKFDWASYIFYGDPRAGFVKKRRTIRRA